MCQYSRYIHTRYICHQRSHNLSATHEHYFVTAATIAAEIHQAMLIAKEISLASSNAGVLSYRAGTSAAGFGALAVFIDELARKTMHASNSINQKAIAMSKLASNSAKTTSALHKFDEAITKAQNAEYVSSLDPVHAKIEKDVANESIDFAQQVRQLKRELENLKSELDVAKVLASMSQVEAVQASKEYQGPLSVNAQNIAEAALRIEKHVKHSLSLLR